MTAQGATLQVVTPRLEGAYPVSGYAPVMGVTPFPCTGRSAQPALVQSIDCPVPTDPGLSENSRGGE